MIKFLLSAMTVVMSTAVAPQTYGRDVSRIIEGNNRDGTISLRGRKKRRAEQIPRDAPLVCQVMAARVAYQKGEGKPQNSKDFVYTCMTTPDEEVDGAYGMVYEMADDLVATIKQKMTGKALPRIQIFGATAHRTIGRDLDVIVAPPNADVVVLPSERRLEIKDISHGTHSVLVIRVSSLDSTNTLSAATISSRLFDLDAVTLSTVYDQCSSHALNFVPAVGPGIVNGVFDLFINQNTNGVPAESFENAVTAAAETQVEGFNNFDHVVYCMPATAINYSGTTDWVAWSYIGWSRTVFNNEWCGAVSAIAHEIGHNMGLGHARKGEDEYGDQTGMMGYSVPESGGPAKCFNAHNHWVFGWFQARSVSLDLSAGPWIGSIVGFTDYQLATTGEYVIVNIKDLYMQYNRAETFNAQTGEMENQLVIVRAENEAADSYLLGGVNPIDRLPFRYIDFDHDADLLVEICSQSDAADKSSLQISIYLETQASRCGESPLVSIAPPTPAPFATTPFVFPTPPPLFQPVVVPTLPPTLLPTLQPSSEPTLPPTPAPMLPTSLISGQRKFPDIPINLMPQAKRSCDDDGEALFFTDEINGYRRCTFLASRPSYRESMCSYDHPSSVRWTCQETCGVCSDFCFDSDAMFLDNDGITRKCEWLSRRPNQQVSLCQPGMDAYTACSETCNSCDGALTLAFANAFRPEAASITLQSKQGALVFTPMITSMAEVQNTEVCEDSKNTTFYDKMSAMYRNCNWLAVSPVYKFIFCREGHSSGARDLCPETCGKCRDGCADDMSGTFEDRGTQRDCHWLSLRTLEQERQCFPGHDAYSKCPKTCNVCDGEI